MHSYNECGMHWETFNKQEGQVVFVEKINDLLSHYRDPFELSVDGEILHKPDAGFEKIFAADVPTIDENVQKESIRLFCGTEGTGQLLTIEGRLSGIWRMFLSIFAQKCRNF